MPVTEDEAANALPPDGWLRRYCVHGFKQTTAPLCYHIGVGLSLLAATCPTAFGMHYAASALRSNQFVLLLGRSGEENKSSALNVGKEILDTAAAPLVGNFPGSAEGLIESLAQQATQWVPMSEFGRFLSSAQGGYFEPIKSLLAEAWDCGGLQRALARQRVIRVDNPRLSLAAACSIPYLEKHTLAEDWTGGFMGRWLVMYGMRERIDPDPVGDRTDFDWLVDEIRRRASTPSAGWCVGLDPMAKRYWFDWYEDISNRILPGNIIGIRSRAPTMARKIALALAWDFGPAAWGQPWEMELDVLDYAIRITELHVKSLIDLSSVIAEHDEARFRRTVLQAISSKGGMATLGEILEITKTKKRPVTDMLDALLESEVIAKVNTTKGVAFALARFG